ncbi:MAG: YbaK/EbsC family protein [Eubacteriales bacterium]
MSIEKARMYLQAFGAADKILEFSESSATVELAAHALGCEPSRIAKSLTFNVGGEPVMVVAAGDVKIDNRRFKEFFGVKAKMLSPDEVETLIGYAVGGVCPFGVNDGVKVYLDESLKRFDVVYPAAGSASSAVKLTIPELEAYSGSLGWVNVCKLPEPVQ